MLARALHCLFARALTHPTKSLRVLLEAAERSAFSRGPGDSALTRLRCSLVHCLTCVACSWMNSVLRSKISCASLSNVAT